MHSSATARAAAVLQWRWHLVSSWCSKSQPATMIETLMCWPHQLSWFAAATEQSSTCKDSNQGFKCQQVSSRRHDTHVDMLATPK
jgi:hypothetical protein